MHVNNLSTSKRTNWKIHPDFLIFWEPSLLLSFTMQQLGGNNWPYDNNLQIKMSFIVCYHWVGLESSGGGGSLVVIFRLLSKAVLAQNAKKRHDRFWAYPDVVDISKYSDFIQEEMSQKKFALIVTMVTKFALKLQIFYFSNFNALIEECTKMRTNQITHYKRTKW